MRRQFVSVFLTVCCAAIVLNGCGYSTRSLLPRNLKTIYIAPFKNNITYSTESNHNTYFPLLETKIQNAVADRFLFDGNLRVAESGNADLTLKGELISYQRDALRYTDNNDVQEYRIQIAVLLKLYNASGDIVWQEPNFVGDTTYFVTGSLAKSEDTAVQDAVTDLAKRIVERTIEDW